jgi:hypothetical protein
MRVSWPFGRYLGSGSKVTIGYTGLAPYAAGCASSGSSQDQSFAGGTGSGRVVFTSPRAAGRHTVTVTDSDGRHLTRSYRVLGPKRLTMHVSKRSVHHGKRERVSVGGLAPYEHVTVRVGGVVVRQGTAGPRGRFATSFAVHAHRGRHQLRVTGIYAGRSDKITVHVRG